MTTHHHHAFYHLINFLTYNVENCKFTDPASDVNTVLDSIQITFLAQYLPTAPENQQMVVAKYGSELYQSMLLTTKHDEVKEALVQYGTVGIREKVFNEASLAHKVFMVFHSTSEEMFEMAMNADNSYLRAVVASKGGEKYVSQLNEVEKGILSLITRTVHYMGN